MLTLVKPNIDDLWFREKLMADEDTMSYNAKWGVRFLFLKKNGNLGMMPGLRILITEDTIVI